MRDAVAFDVHPPHRGGVEQHIDQVIVQQVDLVDVEDTAVGAGQQARRKGVFPVAQHPLQIQGADHPVLGRTDRQLDEPCGGQQRGQAAHRRRLGGALLAADQHPADLRTDRAQDQRQAQPVVPDDRAERISGHRGDGHRAVSAFSPSTLVPQDQTSSNRAGSLDNWVPSDGTISLRVGSHD
ncbi:hypothetical protein C1Y40_02657 [Mycobacterium talmoniae]|uniref:Uncharacterized protein n=1 Tax=Mycobacterium talmoniae TaxID=1858794 RepID=A0A2S8BKF9_9MYCO|nr:hypothetical protein C1Y40_02657 [Mycobacterium talmoniae]